MKKELLRKKLIFLLLLFAFSVSAQQKEIKGTVTDDGNVPLPSVNVIIKGTKTGTQTDFDGHFSIYANVGDVLVFSFVGMKSIEKMVGDEDNLNIQLTTDANALDEVVVIGYGTQKKADLTGAVYSADLGSFKESPNINIVQSLQGTVPGLNIGQVNSAGTTPSISIRGQTSLGGNGSVLIVVDGIMYTGSLTALNPDDIESIEVLKDASSTAIYGAQGANGVLLITTKSGRKNKTPTITYATSYTTQTPTKDLRPLDREGYIDKIRYLFYDEAFLAPEYTTPNPDFNPANYLDGAVLDANGNIKDNNFDWWDAATKTGSIEEHKVNVNGGGENVSYLLSMGYTNQSGYIINDVYKRKSIRANINVDINDWWTVGTQSFATFGDYSGAEPNMSAIIRHAPLLVPYDEDGELIPFPTETVLANPFMTYNVDDYEKQNYLFGNFYTDIKIPFIKGLSYRVNFGNTYRWDRHYYASEYGAGQTGSAYKNNTFRYDYTIDNILTYQKLIAKDHDLTFTLVYGATERKFDGSYASGNGYTSLTLGYDNLQLATNQFASSGGWREALNYQLGRFNYKFKDRYLLTGSIRRDGFSGFAANEKWGVFPSVSAAWVMSNESFLNEVKMIDFLKLRAGYGSIGNLTSRYFSLSRIGRGSAYVFGDGGSTVFGQQLSSLANPNLQWESTDGLNLGLDFALFDGKLKGNIEYYDTETKNQLFPRSVPSITGVTSINVNLGNIRNKGIEFSLTSQNIQTNDFSWKTTLNFSRNTNEIVTLTGEDEDGDGVEDDIVSDGRFIGESIGTIYGYVAGPIYQIGDDIPEGYEPGTSRVVDVNGDGEITPDDRVIIGRTEPAFRAGLLNVITYKNFTLNVFLNTVQGGKDGYLQGISGGIGGRRNQNAILLNYLEGVDYWAPNNPDGKYPRSIGSPQVTPGIYEDRSFIRLQDVALSYNFPAKWLNKTFISGASVFVSGKNLATWTKWDGWDPETGQGYTDNGRPVMKGYSLGLNVTF